MRRSCLLSLLLTALACAAMAQPGGMHMPPADAVKVDVKGTIGKIRLGMGQGMPSLEVRDGGKTVKVLLGSMRYLMEQDFNPKAGDEVEVRGFRMDEWVVAMTVTTRGKTLKLRDESGRPLWMRGRRGR